MRTISLLPAAMLFAGCVSYGATNSPVTEQNAVEVPELVGHWRIPHLVDSPACLAIQPLAERTYRARLDSCEQGHGQALLAEFSRFGGELFAVIRQEVADTTVQPGDGVLLLYEFYRVRTRNDSLFTANLRADELRDYLVNHPAELPFALLEGNGPDLLLTGTPEQLAVFLSAHARDTLLWSSDSAPEGWWARVR